MPNFAQTLGRNSVNRKIDILITDWGLSNRNFQNILSELNNAEVLNIQDAFREEMSSKSDLAKHLNSFISQGLLLPTSEIEKVLSKWINVTSGNFILSNYPRTLEQYTSLLQFIKSENITLNKIWHFKIKDSMEFKNACFQTEKMTYKHEKYGKEVEENWVQRVNQSEQLIKQLKEVSAPDFWKTIEHQYLPDMKETELRTIVENCA